MLQEQQSYLEGLVARLIPEQKKEYEKLIAEQVKLRSVQSRRIAKAKARCFVEMLATSWKQQWNRYSKGGWVFQVCQDVIVIRLAASSDRLDRDPSRRRMLALSKARGDTSCS